MSDERDTERLVFNGVDGAGGGYLLPPLSPREVARVARGERLDPGPAPGSEERRAYREDLRRWHHLLRDAPGGRGPAEGIDPRDLAQAGWGVVFAHDADPALREALAGLLAHRQAQAGAADARFYREFAGPDGYRPGEGKGAFLARHGAGPGPADPRQVPYYLLLVGGPETIPWSFQYQLDVQYAVGRLHFDAPADYARYARSVVAAERAAARAAGAAGPPTGAPGGQPGPPPPPPRAAFFGVQNADDRSTRLSATELVAPLAERFAVSRPGWEVEQAVGDGATKARLGSLLGGPATPALLFTASHGVGFPPGDPRQRPHQGALLCQDWPGPLAWSGAIPERFYFGADDVPGDARLQGLIAFHFACYGAGTPRLDDFARQAFRQREAIAPQAFVSRLPQRLLGHPGPGGGALAVVGHVERVWGSSFLWGQAGRQLGAFEGALLRLSRGFPVGAAMEYFNERYAELAADLSAVLEQSEPAPGDGEEGPASTAADLELAGLWTAHNDARSYVVLGDPAVRLPVPAAPLPGPAPGPPTGGRG